MNVGTCMVCRQEKQVYTIRNGFAICPRCSAGTAKNAFDGLSHRATHQYVNRSLQEFRDSVTAALGTLVARATAIEKRLALLESRKDVTPVTTSKARVIAELLSTSPGMTIHEIQGRTGIKADTIRKTKARLNRAKATSA